VRGTLSCGDIVRLYAGPFRSTSVHGSGFNLIVPQRAGCFRELNPERIERA
jgi:hypothetical protein